MCHGVSKLDSSSIARVSEPVKRTDLRITALHGMDLALNSLVIVSVPGTTVCVGSTVLSLDSAVLAQPVKSLM